ncbi:hypothetical protein Rhow_008039 [Rhodococcus wratislaviensis]|uniref:Uncharacterized protein n=1 Tax=Rhodococcus wratislaviensis TaxID=44752 RepID=A0A402CJD3_RHOWR|nr:hypothetical protein Rhow_008039 [Rhodococcus wratislaviensis]
MVEKGRIVNKIIAASTVHTYIENGGMYPQVRDHVPDLEDDILESYEEHHVADVLVTELAALTLDDERFDANATVLTRMSSTTSKRTSKTGFGKCENNWGAISFERSVRSDSNRRRRRPSLPSNPRP